MSDDRNPYVLLGIPFGASGDEATSAFARRARGLRRAPDGTERLTELTWALNQVQEAIADPLSAVHVYRVPADPGALVPEADGLLRPAPEKLGRTSDSSAQPRSDLVSYARAEAVAAIRQEAASAQQLPPR